MANGWNADSEREAMLRRVAIVLSSLPAPMANRLLGSMGPQSQQAIQRTMTTLSDVDPLERQRALQAFRVSIQQGPDTGASGGGVEEPASVAPTANGATSRVMPSSGVQVTGAPVESSVSTQTPSDSPLAFLGDVDDDTSLALLRVEHPQTVALVLASIAPAQAARVLPQLPAGLRNETLSRLGRLGEVPDAAAAEVALHFRERLANLRRGGESQFKGRRALDAILAAMPGELNTGETGAGQTDAAEQLDNQLHQRAASTSSEAAQPTSKPTSLEFPTADRPAMDLSDKLRQAVGETIERQGANESSSGPTLRVVHDESPNAARANNVDRAITDALNSDEPMAADASVLDSTDSIHQHLISLPPQQLCLALGRVETRDAMLALCGLPNEVAGAALAMLPRADAKKVRASMNALGSLQLREIDEAKERVATASLANAELSVPSIPMAA